MTSAAAIKTDDAMAWAVVTPSFVLDLERCRMLCRSMDRFLAGSWHHYIIVDPVDLPLFAPLAGPRRSVVDKRDILPRGFSFIGKVPFIRLGRIWWSWKHGPVFGWQMQQFTKLLMANHLREDAMLFCDSDVLFVRPFNIGKLAQAGKVRFISHQNAGFARLGYMQNSMKIVGVDPKVVTRFAVNEQLITWHRGTVLALQDHLTRLHGRPWHEAIGSRLMFAEYNIYSFFVDYVQKDNPHIFRDATVYCKTMWFKETAERFTIKDFLGTLKPHQVAICIQSLIGMPPEKVTAEYEKWLENGALPPNP